MGKEMKTNTDNTERKKLVPKTREVAMAIGLPTYCTGKPCKRGHVAPRQTVSRNCTECYKTVYKDKRKELDKKKYANSYEEQIKKAKLKNDPSSLAAKNKRLPWSQREREVMHRRDKEGNYLLSDVRLAEILGRSIKAIQVERSRSK